MGSVFNSILARVLTMIFGLLVVTLAMPIVIMQTPLSGRIFDRAITESADSIAVLVWLIETSPPAAEEAILSTYASRRGLPGSRTGFPMNLPQIAPGRCC